MGGPERNRLGLGAMTAAATSQRELREVCRAPAEASARHCSRSSGRHRPGHSRLESLPVSLWAAHIIPLLSMRNIVQMGVHNGRPSTFRGARIALPSAVCVATALECHPAEPKVARNDRLHPIEHYSMERRPRAVAALYERRNVGGHRPFLQIDRHSIGKSSLVVALSH